MGRNFKKLEDLNIVVKILSEVDETLYNKDRIISKFEDNDFANLLVGVASGAITLGGSIVAISTMGAVAGLSAAGITSGLAAIGGSMLGGIITVAAAPLVVGGLAYFGLKGHSEAVNLKKAINDIYIKSLERKEKLILEIENGEEKSKERQETLSSLLKVLNFAIKNLKEDLN